MHALMVTVYCYNVKDCLDSAVIALPAVTIVSMVRRSLQSLVACVQAVSSRMETFITPAESADCARPCIALYGPQLVKERYSSIVHLNFKIT